MSARPCAPDSAGHEAGNCGCEAGQCDPARTFDSSAQSTPPRRGPERCLRQGPAHETTLHLLDDCRYWLS